MKHETALKLMEMLKDLGFRDVFIMQTLIHCETGMGIGHAMANADHDLNYVEIEDDSCKTE